MMSCCVTDAAGEMIVEIALAVEMRADAVDTGKTAQQNAAVSDNIEL